MPTFEQDLVRIIVVHLDGFGQPSCNLLIGFATKLKKMSERHLSSIRVLRLGLGFGEGTAKRMGMMLLKNLLGYRNVPNA